MKELEVLRVENDRLRLLAQQDSLTGLLNRGTVEARIEALLQSHTPGVLLMMDVDDFKCINNRYGHLMGDKALRELARLLGYYFGKGNIVGRMGGDEFAVFLPGATRGGVKERAERLSARLAQAGCDLGIGSSFRVTMGAAFTAEEGDTFQCLYERADDTLWAGKRDRGKVIRFYRPGIKRKALGQALQAAPQEPTIDIRYIDHQLREETPVAGACFQAFDTFLSVYRFLARGLQRTGQKVHLILISLMNQQGNFIPLAERDAMIELLRQSICTTLRASDIYTQYSSCQFLAMVPGTAQEQIDRITARIQNAFRTLVPSRPDIQLSFCFYPMQPTAAKAAPGREAPAGCGLLPDSGAGARRRPNGGPAEHTSLQ